MACMSETLDVSKLSGWLNAVACCQKGGHTERGMCRSGDGRAQCGSAARL